MKRAELKLSYTDDLQLIAKSYAHLELFYFNDSLNFYEPLIEHTSIHVDMMADKQKNLNVEFELKHILNINFSVALCSTVSSFLSTLDEEKEYYRILT